MPKPIIVPDVDALPFYELRQALKRCIEAATSTARVYDRWPLKFDIDRTAELLKSDTDNGRLHAWIIDINKAIPDSDRNDKNMLIWELTIRMWGFIGYEYGVDNDNTQTEMEEECRKIVQILNYNRVHLSLDNTQSLKDVGFLQFDEIETEGFGQDDIIVARGEIIIKLQEFYTDPA